jgi:long-chain acyl-CoA synthetase
VGIPDAQYGQEILACVVTRPGKTCSVDELREYCRGALGSYKTPKEFRFVDDLPKGPSGKVQRLAPCLPPVRLSPRTSIRHARSRSL